MWGTTFFVVAFTVPVFNMIKRLVWEKESRIREGMYMMGLTPMAVPISWIVSYMGLYLCFALVFSLLLTKNLLINGVFYADVPISTKIGAVFKYAQ